MSERREFTLSKEQLDRLYEACRAVTYMVVGGVAPSSPQENANRAWCQLGEEMGFDGMTVEPTSKGDRVFTAVPTAAAEAPK